MERIVLLLGLMSGCAGSWGETLTMADVKAKDASQLSQSDLLVLMPGAKVVSYTVAGSRRTWENKVDGSFVASSDGRGSSAGRNNYGTGSGTWRVSDNGKYCIKLQWNASTEDWCRFIFKAGDKYYGFGKLEDTAQATSFEFSK